ncbi:unnamed protein product [Bemisia tabaci]|uniref:Protein dead ringer n=1 Tax=Bemisia tabaci TaxID=7038 RepID=A0A9P0C6Y5_BEMTA|nr:PREDICTED: protein dead ringer homolog isoform X1 [Bemisia tabaci]CAH0753898.1 unnamed protein product [Bemisia tabaci]
MEDMDHRESDLEGSMSSPEMSDGEDMGDEDIDDQMHREIEEHNDDDRKKLRMAEKMAKLTKSALFHERDRIIRRGGSGLSFSQAEDMGLLTPTATAASPMVPPPPFSLPLPFPFLHPAAALPFLPPSAPVNVHQTSSASSHSSESSSSSQQTWSFEEQFKQVRQLYELSDDPKRKEFLDDLFSFMQRRGTPINRLPIMAKSVLDLYELYNLVIQRGGLVDVINKKLWQEIIKGLNLPSSITSAAFTLRTQYMKYLYPYECEKKRLSSPSELQAAIDGNRREGRRGSYGAMAYADMVHRSPTSMVDIPQSVSPAQPQPQPQPLNLVTTTSPRRPHSAHSATLNGNGNGHHNNHHSAHHPSRDSTATVNSHLSSHMLPPSSGDESSRPGSNNSSLVVSMDINGIMYQGVLFAQSATNSASQNSRPSMIAYMQHNHDYLFRCDSKDSQSLS